MITSVVKNSTFICMLITLVSFPGKADAQSEITIESLRDIVDRRTMIRTIREVETAGSPCLFEDFKAGHVTLSNNVRSETFLMNYNVHEESDSRFVLILDQLFFEPFAVEVGGGTYAGHESRVEHRLKLEMNYLIWDNVSGEAVEWGNLDITNRFDAMDKDGSYAAILQEALGKIMMSTPFS